MNPPLLRPGTGAPLQFARELGLFAVLLAAASLGCDGAPWVLGEPLTRPGDAGSEASADAASTLACDDVASPSVVNAAATNADGQMIGNPALVADCRPTERRLLRIGGDGLKSGAFTMISCAGRPFAE